MPIAKGKLEEPSMPEEAAEEAVYEEQLIITKRNGVYEFSYNGMKTPSQAITCLDLCKKDLMIQLNRGTFNKEAV